MNKTSNNLIAIFLFFLSFTVFAQTEDTEDTLKVYKTSWYVGISGSYPRFLGLTQESIAGDRNVGGALHLGYNITEHFSLRLSPGYVLLHSFYYKNNGEQDNFVNMGVLNLELIYNILPCERITPFLLVGYGATYFGSSNPYLGTGGERVHMEDNFTGYQLELGVGAEFKFWNRLSLRAELNYLNASNNKIDGNDSDNETKGLLSNNGDAYMNLGIGLNWYFWRGKRSRICEPEIKIQEVITEIPIEKIVVDTVFIDNIIEKAIVTRESFVLEKVKFKFDEAALTEEAKLILLNVAKILNKYPEEKIEIIGHTDSWGNDEYNMELSNKRAALVRRFLTANGVDSTRLFTTGCGEREPIASNNTKEGRALNRRIEFSIFDGTPHQCPEPIGVKPKETNDEILKITKAIQNKGKLTFSNINFRVNSDEILDNSKEILDNVVVVLNELPNVKLDIQGYTDSDGNKKYNQDLSARRAASVKKYLVAKGIAANRLTTKGFGESNPIADNKTKEGRAKNRRIEFEVVD
ncbi:MAG: hypothetical protein CR986_08095 [Ignavibacteriae bacterium]|nr:MAG: hypothetical protein CR986_08095 [Ignavibacteriota bacterium]